eukprot:CAMPEP_0177592920 /NCGR_PEP_ID=MMETSP0419_2-20121207/8829_1 /TAXON_ID=582737 /ORGANISM="Tetraselmis sp., Strain GSL018" /LENGTH=282 /DNA_ID=CAMNT_0019083843 /DNA_START=363 /DNA_END=1213 /DNA_ORIENTATION=-
MPVEAAMACSWSSPETESDGEDANNIMQQTDLLLKAVHQLVNERSMQELTVRHPTFHEMIGFTRQPESSSAGSAPQIPSTASFSFVHRAADGRRRLPQKICSMFRAGLRSLGKAGGCALGSVSRVVRGEPFDGPRLKGETVVLEEAWDHQICGAVFGLVCLVLATVFLQRVGADHAPRPAAVAHRRCPLPETGSGPSRAGGRPPSAAKGRPVLYIWPVKSGVGEGEGAEDGRRPSSARAVGWTGGPRDCTAAAAALGAWNVCAASAAPAPPAPSSPSRAPAD